MLDSSSAFTSAQTVGRPARISLIVAFVRGISETRQPSASTYPPEIPAVDTRVLVTSTRMQDARRVERLAAEPTHMAAIRRAGRT